MSNERFFVKRLTTTATLPKRGSAQAAGYDLCADLPDIKTVIIPACYYSRDKVYENPFDLSKEALIVERVSTGSYLVSTGLAVKIPEGYYGRVASRSGLAVKSCLEVGAGVIDSDYRGEVKVLVRNLGGKPFQLNHGDRIAQLIIEKITTPDIEEVDDLDVTERGAAGFGSTGVNSDIKTLDVAIKQMCLEPKLSNNIAVLSFACTKCKELLPQFPHDGLMHKITCTNCHEVNYLSFNPSFNNPIKFVRVPDSVMDYPK
jgi:dUTP pyrophosphatase